MRLEYEKEVPRSTPKRLPPLKRCARGTRLRTLNEGMTFVKKFFLTEGSENDRVGSILS
jgi:hypothetical protein